MEVKGCECECALLAFLSSRCVHVVHADECCVCCVHKVCAHQCCVWYVYEVHERESVVVKACASQEEARAGHHHQPPSLLFPVLLSQTAP